jgi:hypothetical protein
MSGLFFCVTTTLWRGTNEAISTQDDQGTRICNGRFPPKGAGRAVRSCCTGINRKACIHFHR